MRADVGYHIAIKTGSVNGASSDSKVFVKLYGEKGDTDKVILAVSDNDLRNYFETARTDIFTLDTYDIGKASVLYLGEKSRSGTLFKANPCISSICSVCVDQPSSDWSHK